MAPEDHALASDPRMLRAVLDATRLLIFVVDQRGLVSLTNRAVEQVTGLSGESARRPIWELAAIPAEQALLKTAFDPFKPESFPPGLLFHLRTATISPHVVDCEARVLYDDQGVASVVLTGVDVSDRLAAERQLRETEAFQRTILERLPAIVWTTDRDLRFTFSAGGGLASLGLSFGQVALVGTSLYNYFQTSDPAHPAIAPHLRALEGESVVYETAWLDRQFQTRTEPFRDRSDNIVGTIGLALDVTEQARTAEALQQSEAHLRRLVDANVIGVLFWGENGRVNDANQAFLDLMGFSRDELLAGGISWRDLTPPEFHLVDDRAVAELRATGRCAQYEKEFFAKDGTRVPVLIGSATFDDTPGAALAGVAFMVDLREQVRLRRARDQLLLKEQSARMETELANARLLLLVEGSKRLSRTRNASDTLETLAALVVPALADWSYVIHRGWGGGPILAGSAHGDPNRQKLLRALHGCSAPDLAAPEGAARVFRTGEVALYDDVTNDQLLPGPPGWPLVGTRDPAFLHLVRELGMRSLLCVPVTGRDGVDAVMMLVSSTDPHRYDADDTYLARDLASRAAVSLENGRLLFEAMDAVRARDDFLAVAAHELRTPLTSLMLQIQLLGRALERDHAGGRSGLEQTRRGVGVAETQARRLSVLIDGLLDVARLTTNRMWLRVEEVDLRQLIDGLVSAMAGDFQRAGCAVTVTAPGRVTGRWDRARLEQVLTNLLTNAVKFGAGRPIDVTVQATATNVLISVRDEGIGISKEDQARIFDRFERAVSSRHFGGFGLGLYISVQILGAHRGSLRVESEPGHGACFTIDLPRGARSSAVSGASPAAPA